MKTAKKALHINKVAVKITAAAFISALIIVISYFSLFEIFELATLDLRFKIRPPQKTSPNIVIIEIAQDTLDELGTWPIDREFYARLTDALTEYNAYSIIFDIVFTQKQSEASDEELLASVKSSKRVYLAQAFKLNKISKDFIFPQSQGLEIFPFPGLDKAARGVGHINIIPDIDGKRRRAPVFIGYNNKLYPQLSFLAACDYLAASRDGIRQNKKFIRISPNIKIPIDENGNMIINFADRWERAFKHYSFVDILKSYVQIKGNEKPILDLNLFKGKICIIGLTATGTHDLNPVPLEANYPMVGVHVNIINSILTNNFIKRFGNITNILILILLGFITSFLTLKLKPLKGLLITVGLLFIFTSFAFFIFAFFNIWVNLFYPLLLISLVYISATFYKYISERNKRMLMERELDIAYTIQKSFLKDTPPPKKELDIAVLMDPARTIGGDLYDFVDISEEKIGVMIGDVSGKGIPAALFMAKTVSEFRFHSKAQNLPQAAITQLNNQISTESTSGLFVTVCYLVFDTKEKLVHIVNAGHLPVIVAHKKGSVEALLIVESETAIGIMDGIEFKKNTMPFNPGDVFLLYTDGVTESWNRKKEEFGEDRLKQVLAKSASKTAKEIIGDILKDVRRFQGRAPQHDDITLLAVKV